MSDDAKKEVDLVAQLLASTGSQLKAIDEQVVDGSKPSQNPNWKPQDILKDHIAQVAPPPGQGPAAQYPAPPVPAGALDPMQLQPMSPVPAPVPVGPAPVDAQLIYKLDRIERLIETLAVKVENLETLDTKLTNSVERGLKNRMKQITIKLDDTKDK